MSYTWLHAMYLLICPTCSEEVSSGWKDSPKTVLDVYRELIQSGLRIWVFRCALILNTKLFFLFSCLLAMLENMEILRCKKKAMRCSCKSLMILHSSIHPVRFNLCNLVWLDTKFEKEETFGICGNMQWENYGYKIMPLRSEPSKLNRSQI